MQEPQNGGWKLLALPLFRKSVQVKHILCVGLWLLLFTGSAAINGWGQRVTFDSDIETDFTAYDTHAPTQGTSARSSLTDQRIKDGVEKELPAKPLQRVVGTDQEVVSEPKEQQAQSAPSAQPETQSKRGALVIAPIPISSPAIGSGTALGFGYIFPFSRMDKVSPPSVIGVVGLFTNNSTRAFALGGQFYLKQNTYKVTTVFGRGNLNYDLYGSRDAGLKLPLKQTGQGFQGELLRRVGWEFFLGPRFSIGSSTLTVRSSGGDSPPPPPDVGISTTLTAIGATLTRDTSPNRFYPTSGSYFKFTSDFFSQSLGSKYSFQSYVTTFAKYWAFGKNHVLAYDAYFCATGGQPPFYGNCIYGTSNQLRGYVAGKYFDRYMVTTQLEYRLSWPWRFGAVAFGGVGEAIPGGDSLLFKDNNFLPSGGVGLRFQLSKQYHVNLRADVARGKDGHTFSLGVGEAF